VNIETFLYTDERKGAIYMIQGTTPTHKFNLDIPTNTISKVRISYEQHGKIVLHKEKDDCELTANAITVKLTQEETLKFIAPENVRIQLHVLTEGNDSLVSRPIKLPAYILLDKVVLTND
jgi:hypothetical protein